MDISIASLAALLSCSFVLAAEPVIQPSAESIPALVAALRASDVAGRPAIEAKLVQAGPDAVRALLPEMRRRKLLVFEALGKMGDAAVPPLLGLLKDAAVGGYAREALFQVVASGSAKPIPDLLACMKDDELVGACGTALAKASGPAAKAYVPEMVKMLKGRGERRIYAAAALAQVGPAAAQAVPALMALLKDAEPAARWSAAKALGAIGAQARAARPALAAAAKNDSDGDVRRFAAQALKKIPAVSAAAKQAGVKGSASTKR